MSKFQAAKSKIKTVAAKTKTAALDQRNHFTAFYLYRALRSRDYKRAALILSKNPHMQGYALRHKDKIFWLLSEYRSEIEQIMQIVKMKNAFEGHYNDRER